MLKSGPGLMQKLGLLDNECHGACALVCAGFHTRFLKTQVQYRYPVIIGMVQSFVISQPGDGLASL